MRRVAFSVGLGFFRSCFLFLKFSANFIQFPNPVLCEEKVHISVETKLLGRERPDCIKD